nr:MAG TPA: hypothetical protein [Caudoviricetes sp.]
MENPVSGFHDRHWSSASVLRLRRQLPQLDVF